MKNINVLMAATKSFNMNLRTALNIIQGDEVKIRHSIFEVRNDAMTNSVAVEVND